MTKEIVPEIFTVDYEGEPGKRAFFLQIRSSEGAFTLGIEKQQVGALAESLAEILLLVDADDPVKSAQPSRQSALGLTPIESEWRVGSIGLGYEESLEMVAVLLEPLSTGEDEEPVEDTAFTSLRLMIDRNQARVFVLHALAVVAEGRPLCQLCGLPMDPEGHTCPASNGHKTTV